MVDKIRIPMYESLVTSKKRMRGNFHALPIQNLECDKKVILEPGFLLALDNAKNLDISITAPFFDSLSDPSQVIGESANIISNIYDSDLSLFVTCGSTISNKIIIDGICKKGDKVICQSGVHQSIHFSLMNSSADVHFINDVYCDNTDIYRADAGNILANIKENSYKTLIINSQTYDGVCFDLSKFLDEVCTINESIENIIIDEAWGAWSTFSSYMKEKSAVANARRLSDKHKINFIVIHSMHKSLFSFRQSSLINIYGDDVCQSKITSSHFKNHTTSPSYPILASTELAAIHAFNFGNEYSERSLSLIKKFKKYIRSRLVSFEWKDININNNYFFYDPTKIWITCNDSLFSGKKLRDKLFNYYGIYISRYSDNSILLNFHCGITEGILALLEKALLDIDKKINSKNKELNITIGDTSNSFFILYPPGIPIITPGQKVSENTINKIHQSKLNNISLLVVEGN